MTNLSGPLGLWKFPFLGILFNLLSGGGHGHRSTTAGTSSAPASIFTQNEERAELVRDKKGQLTGIIVHRKLE